MIPGLADLCESCHPAVCVQQAEASQLPLRALHAGGAEPEHCMQSCWGARLCTRHFGAVPKCCKRFWSKKQKGRVSPLQQVPLEQCRIKPGLLSYPRCWSLRRSHTPWLARMGQNDAESQFVCHDNLHKQSEPNRSETGETPGIRAGGLSCLTTSLDISPPSTPAPAQLPAL